MTKRAFDKIAAGLEEAVAHAAARPTTGLRLHRFPTVDVRAVRKRVGLTQEAFAAEFGWTPAVIRDWEQGRRQPPPPDRVLLKVIETAPEVVRAAIAAA
jgi:putative transcriptional regulator